MKKQAKKNKILALLITLIMLPIIANTSSVMAEEPSIILPNLISDNALFQREKPIKIWGTAIAGESVSIRLVDGNREISSARTTADSSGNFNTELPSAHAGGPYDLKVSCSDIEKTVSNILIGELWFLSGQSNMETTVNTTYDPYKSNMLNCVNENDNIRLFIRSYGWDGSLKTDVPQSDLDGKWVTVTKENVEIFSSVGWSTIKELYDNLGGCPVGGIASSASGSTMYSFRKNSDGTFNKIIAPVTNMNIRGMFWYQGEGDKDNPNFARDFNELVTEYRTEWNNPNMPVIYVQLAASPKLILGNEDFTNTRYAQLQALYDISSPIGMVTAADITLPDSTDLSTLIHYSDKQIVGQRLARTAANLVYGIDEEFLAPTYTGYKVQDSQIIVNFANTYSGLAASDGKSVRGFTVAGNDGVFKKATAVISADKNSVILTSSEVASPISFRYCDDTNLSGIQFDGEIYLKPNLVNSAGIAALACASSVTGTKEIKPLYTLPIQDFNYKIGSDATLPKSLTLTAADGTSAVKNVTWNTSVDTAAEKHFTVFGSVDDTDVLAIANVNIMKNTDFSVAQTTPADKEQDVSLNKPITVKFNKPLNPAGLTDENITVTANGKLIDKTISYNSLQRIIKLDFPKFAGTKYTVTISKNITNKDGAALGRDFSFTFISDSVYYYEDFSNVTDPTLSTDAGSGYKKISDSAKIHIGSGSAEVKDNVMRMQFKNGTLMQYSINGGIEIKNRTVISYDMTRHDVNANLGVALYLNDMTDSNIRSAIVDWCSDNTICGTKLASENNTHHIEIVLDPFMKNGYLYLDGAKITEYDLSNVTDWRLTRIIFERWGGTADTPESAADIDNITVRRLNTSVYSEDIHSSISDKQEGVGINEAIVLNLGKEIISDSLNGKISITTGGKNIDYTGTYDIINNTYTILPQTEPNTVYTLKIDDFTAADGTNVAGITTRFKTALYGQNFDDVNELEFIDNEARINGTNVKIHKGDADVQVMTDSDGKYLNMQMGQGCQVQYVIQDIVSGTAHNKVSVGYDLYIDDFAQSFTQKILFGGSKNINNDNYSMSFDINTDGSIAAQGRSQSESGVIKKGNNNIQLIFDFEKFSTSVYVNNQKIIDEFSIFETAPNIDSTQCTGIGKLVFLTWNGDSAKHNYKLDNICIKAINSITVNSSLKHGENTLTELTSITDANNLNAAFNIKNNGFENEGSLMVATAIYNSIGALKAVTQKTLADVDSSYSYNCDNLRFTDNITIENGDTIKLFVWKSGVNTPVSMPNIVK